MSGKKGTTLLILWEEHNLDTDNLKRTWMRNSQECESSITGNLGLNILNSLLANQI